MPNLTNVHTAKSRVSRIFPQPVNTASTRCDWSGDVWGLLSVQPGHEAAYFLVSKSLTTILTVWEEDYLRKIPARSSVTWVRLGPCTVGKYRLIRPIDIAIEPVDDTLVATFHEADISFGGDNRADALESLKIYMVELLETFEEFENSLGPEAAFQLGILRSIFQHAV